MGPVRAPGCRRCVGGLVAEIPEGRIGNMVRTGLQGAAAVLEGWSQRFPQDCKEERQHRIHFVKGTVDAPGSGSADGYAACAAADAGIRSLTSGKAEKAYENYGIKPGAGSLQAESTKDVLPFCCFCTTEKYQSGSSKRMMIIFVKFMRDWCKDNPASAMYHRISSREGTPEKTRET